MDHSVNAEVSMKNGLHGARNFIPLSRINKGDSEPAIFHLAEVVDCVPFGSQKPGAESQGSWIGRGWAKLNSYVSSVPWFSDFILNQILPFGAPGLDVASGTGMRH